MQANVSPIPRIVGSDLSIDNAIGFPFVAYEWVEGKPLLWNDHEPQDQVQRDERIKSLARFTIETACRLQKPGKFPVECS
jgi:aminoglycoside phosphotransferase (APT) family kinase protein